MSIRYYSQIKHNFRVFILCAWLVQTRRGQGDEKRKSVPKHDMFKIPSSHLNLRATGQAAGGRQVEHPKMTSLEKISIRCTTNNAVILSMLMLPQVRRENISFPKVAENTP